MPAKWSPRTHTYRVAGDASLNVCFSFSGSAGEMCVCSQVTWLKHGAFYPKVTRQPFHCLDVNIVYKHEFTSAGMVVHRLLLMAQFVTAEITS